MALPLWGQLEKSTDDPQTIEEAIDAAIAAHNEESDAHLGLGQSLESHKSEDVIDHPPESVLPDKLRFQIFSTCLLDDGFFSDVTSGNTLESNLLDNQFFIQSKTGENFCRITSGLGGLTADWSQDHVIFEVLASSSFGSGFDVKWKLGLGFLGLKTVDGNSAAWPTVGFYFDVGANDLYAFYFDSSGNIVNELLVSDYTADFYKLNFQLIDGDLFFYVNDTEVHSVSSPTFDSFGADDSYLYYGTDHRQDSESANPGLNIKYISYSQPQAF